ncbi:hypothetical protein BZA77DRAFT_359872 [Pyronema omphalodes]|nr:hypothetical protein BZA77DRAFT_359872 [Pyronema omphalodes]
MSPLPQNPTSSSYSPKHLEHPTSLQLQTAPINQPSSNNPTPSITTSTNNVNETQTISLTTQLTISTHDNNHMIESNPTPALALALTPDNINKIDTTLDYGLKRWLSQKKEENAVRFYGF